MRTWFKIFILIGIVLVVDLTTKHFLCDVEYFNLIPNVISIATNHGNDGAAWGIFSGKRLFLILISLIMIAALLIFDHFVKGKNKFYTVSMGLILGGALGNLVDRILFGSVRDFIFLEFFPTFPVFNIADSCLCVGAIMLAIFILFMGKEKKN